MWPSGRSYSSITPVGIGVGGEVSKYPCDGLSGIHWLVTSYSNSWGVGSMNLYRRLPFLASKKKKKNWSYKNYMLNKFYVWIGEKKKRERKIFLLFGFKGGKKMLENWRKGFSWAHKTLSSQIGWKSKECRIRKIVKENCWLNNFKKKLE